MIRSLTVSAVLAGSLAFSGAAQASVATFGCADAFSCTLEELFDGGGFVVNDLVIADWSLDFFDSGTAAPDLADIVVFADALSANTAELFYDVGPNLDTFGQDFTEFEWSFTVDDLYHHVQSATQSLDFPFFDGDGGVVAIETFLDDFGGAFADLLTFEDNLFAEAQLFDTTDIAKADFLRVTSTAILFGDFDDDLVGLDGFAQTFTVPEPATLALLGLGLIGVGAARRRRG